MDMPSSAPRDIIIKNPTVLTPFKRIERGCILIRTGRIEYVGPIDPQSEPFPEARGELVEIEASGLMAIPGLIDLHIHGGGGQDTMDASPEAISRIAKTHARHGTTAFLPTTVTAPEEDLLSAASCVREAMKSGTGGAKPLGVHVEGPFINPEHKGAQLESYIRPISREEVLRLQEASGNAVRMLTFAPEIEGAPELAQWLESQGIVASIGHTGASYEEALEGIRHGMHHVTHLFNGMRSLHHREPGVLGAVLDSPGVSCQLIADGFHLHPAILRLVFKLKGRDGIVLVTDAMEAVDLPEGTYDLGGQKVNVRGGKATLENGRLAGSTLTMERAVINASRFIGCDVGDALRMATINPARVIGAERCKGSLEPGKDADVVLLTPEWQVALTIVEGEVVYRGEAGIDI